MARDGLREAPLRAVVVWRRCRLGLEHGDGRRLIGERLLVALALEQELGAVGQRGRPLGRRSAGVAADKYASSAVSAAV